MLYTRKKINENWELRSWEPGNEFDIASLDSQAEWYDAKMPRQVHEILLDHKVIENPCLPGGRLEECLWVAESDWIYRCSFQADESALISRIVFGGLDTLADIYLNGKQIGSHRNMFVPLSIDVTETVESTNVLLIHFHSPHHWLSEQSLPERWEGKVTASKLLRKASHDFDSYLSGEPYFTNIGVFADVVLEQSDTVILDSSDIDCQLSADFSRATIQMNTTLIGDPKEISAQIALIDPHGTLVGETMAAYENISDNMWACTGELVVDQPVLWWPKGHGEQTLYSVELILSGSNGEILRSSHRVGFRTIDIDEHLECKVNGRRIRLWGANLAPISGWTHRWQSERVRQILDRADLGNMNCLRIWGGGEWYHDELYEEADDRGILLWQDFPNEYGHCPDTADFFANCKSEAEHLTRRLRHHPSIMLWCGGNEAHMGADFNHRGDTPIGTALYEEVYAEVCKRLDPRRYYHVNSPHNGAFPNDPSRGDTHNYTTTWYVPGIEFPVFTTENMRISTPPHRSMIRYLGKNQVWPEGYDGRVTKGSDLPWPKSWHERTSANSWRKIPAIEEYPDPVDGQSLIFAYGAAHGRYLRKSIEAHRRGRASGSTDTRRISQGHLVWKLNATWPHLYSNIIGYFLEPYIPYYEVKRAYEPVQLNFDVGNHIWLWVVNDSPTPVVGTFRVLLYDMRNNTFLDEMTGSVTVGADESRELTSLDRFGQFDQECVLYAELLDANNHIVSRSTDFVCIDRYMRYPEAKLTMKKHGDSIVVSSDVFARCVELTGNAAGDEFGWLFSDNYFDLAPWEEKQITVAGMHSKGKITAKSYYSRFATTITYGEPA